MLSGKDDEATRARALAALAADYLVKLPTKAVLMACLDRHLSARAEVPAEADTTATDDASDVALDPEFLATYRDAGAADPDETLRELLDVFLRDADRLIGDLRRAAAAGFNAAVPRVAARRKARACESRDSLRPPGERAIEHCSSEAEPAGLLVRGGAARKGLPPLDRRILRQRVPALARCCGWRTAHRHGTRRRARPAGAARPRSPHHRTGQATSAVYGIPKAAAALNAAVDILPLDRIAGRIVEVARVRLRRPPVR